MKFLSPCDIEEIFVRLSANNSFCDYLAELTYFLTFIFLTLFNSKTLQSYA